MKRIEPVSRVTYPRTAQDAPQDVLVRVLGWDGEWERELRWRRPQRGQPGALQVVIRLSETTDVIHTGDRVTGRMFRHDPLAERVWDTFGAEVLWALIRSNPNRFTLMVDPRA